MKKDEKRVFYIDNEDRDVITLKKERKVIPDDYDFIPKSKWWKFKSFVIFYITKFIIFFVVHINLHVSIKNKKIIRKIKDSGFVLYGNHVYPVSDAFSPALISHKRIYTIISPSNLDVPFMGRLLPYLGGVPLGHTDELKKRFNDAIDERLKENKCVIIFPEAHVWPYYTKIRDFSDASFKYPVRNNVPVFTFVTTFQKRKFFKKPKVTIYIDGPFYQKEDLSFEENKKLLHDLVYDSFIKYSKYSTYEYYKYTKKEAKK